MRKHFLLTVLVSLLATAAFAAVGPQSVHVTFNGDNAEGWVASSGGSITSVADGVANVQMAAQSGTPTKYRADFQYNTTGFTMDKSKDVVWAIKLTTTLPGTANSRKFEIQYIDGSDKWINGIEGPSSSLDCADGGKIYYFNLGADGLNKLSDLPEGTINVKQIHFIMADATDLTAETAKYAVDWVASFTSVNALIDFKDWNDEAQEATASLPYLELGFLPKADGTGYDVRNNGFVDVELEGNYNVKLFAIEYFLIPDFSIAKQYTLKLETNGGGGYNAIAVWDFPYQITSNDDAAALNTKAAAVTGVVPGSGDVTSAIDPIASSTCEANFWTLAIPGSQLTPLATIGEKTLVGLFVTSQNLETNSSAKFASAAHPEKAKPALVESGIDPSVIILNTTQQRVENTLAEAVEHANANDVITIYNDVTISGSRLEITKELTIQGATGIEKIICGVSNNSIMVLATGAEIKTITFKNLIVDGNNANRSTQTFENGNDNSKLEFENVSVINTTYSVVTGDVKNNGSEIILNGTNSFPTGIYLNRNKRVDGQNASHTDPMNIILAGDYDENYAIVLCTSDPRPYQAIDADGATGWELYDGESGSCHHELKGRKIPLITLNDNADNSTAISSTYVGQKVDATIVRSMPNDGTTNATFCVPFDVDATIVARQLGNANLVEYKDATINGDEATFHFVDAEDGIKAGVPYLICPEAGATLDLTFRGVTIKNETHPAEDTHYSFIPLFSQTNVGTESENKSIVYLGANNQLFWAGASCTIDGFRAYLQAKSAPAQAVKRFAIGRGTPTDVSNVQRDKVQSTKILRNGQVLIVRDGIEYNLMGQKVK